MAIQTFNPTINDEFDLEPAEPHPAWLWNGYYRVRTHLPQENSDNSATENIIRVALAILSVWFLASLSASACVFALATMFR